ncbi:MAG: hypothetical protein ACI3XR_01385 [Eubacteriales bacterium]
MNKAKILSLILTLPILSSCSMMSAYTVTDDRAPSSFPAQSAVIPTVTQTPASRYPEVTVRTPEEELSGLAEFDGGGSVFLIATLEDAPENPIFPSDTSPGASAAVQRIHAIEDKYNIRITAYPTTVEKLLSELEANIQVDGYTADLILIPAERTGEIDGEGVLIDPERIAFFDSEAPYLCASLSESFGDYAIFGDALLRPENTLCVFYNLSLAESLGIGSLYSCVESGKWTWEVFANAAAKGKAASELPLAYPIAMTHGSAYSDLFGRDKSLKELSEENQAIVNGVTEAIGENFISEDSLTTFLSGQSLFYIGTLSDAEKMGQLSDPWSLLPIPAAEEGQEYMTLRDYRQSDFVFLIPKFPYSPERSVQIIAALCSVCDQTRQEIREMVYPYLRVNEARILLEWIL